MSCVKEIITYKFQTIILRCNMQLNKVCFKKEIIISLQDYLNDYVGRLVVSLWSLCSFCKTSTLKIATQGTERINLRYTAHHAAINVIRLCY